MYQPDDFFRKPENEGESNHIEKDPENMLLPITKSASLNSMEDAPPLPPRPPRPPKRTKSSSESELLERLKEAGVIISEVLIPIQSNNHSASSDNIDTLFQDQKPLSRPKSCDSRLQIESDDRMTNGTVIKSNTLPSGLLQFDSLTDNASFSHKPVRESLFTQSDRKIKTLSAQDLLTLEDVERVKSLSFIESGPKPPPRPASPNINRFSCPPGVGSELNPHVDNTKIFFGNSLFQKAKERNDEAIAFRSLIADVRKLYRCTDLTTNPGYISPAVVKNNAIHDDDVNVCVYFETLADPRSFTCKLSCTANQVIASSIAHFRGDCSELDLLSDQYVLKVIGYTMYMHGDTKLCDYVHVQESLIHGANLNLSIVRRNHVNVELSRDQKDDEEDCSGVHFQHYFNIPASLTVSEQGLTVLLDTYNKEVAELIKNVAKTNENKYVPDKLIQVVKAISSALANVELLQVQDAVNMLLSLKKSTDNFRTISHHPRDQHNFNQYLNPMYFDRGRFHLALEKLTAGVYSLIKLYCKAFQTQFTPLESEQRHGEFSDVYERIDPRSLTDKFIVRLSSVHRLPSEWKHNYEQFEVSAGLYYGGHSLCPVRRSQKSRVCVGFFELIRFDELLEFDIVVKKIPREAKLGYVLYGLSPPKKGTDGKTVLGWFTCNMYSYEGFLQTGSRLFGLLNDDEFNPVATCATNNIQRANTVIAKIDFQVYHTEVIFPEPVLLSGNISHENKRYSEREIQYIASKMLQKDLGAITKEEKRVIWDARFSLLHLPNALVYVLVAVPSWDSENVVDVHLTLSCWCRLPPGDALELLQADYPDKIVRETAVLWLADMPDDDLCECLLEVVQALKYEAYHNSALAQFLIKRALANPRIAHYLFWHLKYYTGDRQFCQRFQLVLSGLLSVCGVRLRSQLSKQDALIVSLSTVASKVKDGKESLRTVILQNELANLNRQLDSTVRLPLDPAIKISSVIPENSSYFSSNTVPLKVAFRNVDPRGEEINVMFKIGDDLRKDLVTQLMFGVMNKLWINEGLDLNMMLYKVLPTGPLTGLIEIVPNATTFREIHVQHGLTGSFKDDSLALWLQRFNSSEKEYHKAVQNFTASAAGYCVATYLLGIGDRHNDNIMLTKNGHVFHIDFSKFMGDVQKFGSIKRDRVPFVLTPDMAYVINNGVTSTQNFQKFIEYCCTAFNIIRRNSHVVLNLLGLMVYSGIAYLSHKEDLSYVSEALHLHLNEEEATMYFTRLIENSLSSRSTQLNFFIHNVAQMKNVTDTILRSSRSSPLFSFANKVHSAEEDGIVTSARVVDFQKRYVPDKHYVFVINVTRENLKGPKFVFRRFEDFQELHAKLSYIFNVFSGTVLPDLPAKIIIGRSQIREVAVKRRGELDHYLNVLANIPDVWGSEIVCSFLHSYIKDVEEERRFAEFVTLLQDGRKSRIGGKLKLSLVYKHNSLRLLIMHASNLIPRRLQGLANPYVKCYLLPDPLKRSKTKTKVCRKSLNPTFNETIVYDQSWEVVRKRILQITVWDYDHLVENEFLGGVNFYLSTFDLKEKRTDWYTLTDVEFTE